MKNKEKMDIQNLAILERIAEESPVLMPDGLDVELGEMIDSMDKAEKILSKEKSPLKIRLQYAAVAVSVVLLFSTAILWTIDRNKLVDTYDSPELAYAKLEESLSKLGKEINYGKVKINEGQNCIDKHVKRIEELIK